MPEYAILPFQFRDFGDECLLVNEAGDHAFLGKEDFERFIGHELSEESEAYHTLKSHLMLAGDELELSLRKLAARYRTRKAFLREFTTLHMMVITLRCNQRCEYCQVACAEENASEFDMSPQTAKKAVDIILQAPAKTIKIEFQGGEPLLNWDVIQETVHYAKEAAARLSKDVGFVICTNLTLITGRQLEFCKEQGIEISTSLDGPANIHDACRVARAGGGTHALFMEKLALARFCLGEDGVDALMTTSAMSLDHLREIVDEYVDKGFNGIFFRSLNPYGFAAEQADLLGYETERFVEKYLEALDYILELNKRLYFPERFATLLFSRILTPFSTGFVDLQSPAGAGICAAIYDYDGSVYPSDEARMLARMGDTHFRLGNVETNSFADIFASAKQRQITRDAVVETTVPCAFCAYQAYCGADPVRNYLETGSEVRNMAGSPFCVKHRLIFDGLFERLKNADQTRLDIIWSWINNDPSLVRRA